MDSKNGSKKMPKNAVFFYCKACDFKCTKKSNYENHVDTLKHKRIVNDSNGIFCIKLWRCSCGKEYKYDSGFYRHKKRCTYTEENEDDVNLNQIITSNDVSKELILKLVEENSEIKSMLFKQFENMQEQQVQIQNQMMEQQKLMHNQISDLIPKVGNNNIINNNVKQKFNINIFLNEQCKDALTMNEFVDTIKIKMSDLMVTKNKGLSEGVSNILIENMNKLSPHERPIHCTDVKRETMYVKCDGDPNIPDSNAYWEKDSENKILKQAIKKVSHEQIKKIAHWVEDHPNWQENQAEQEEYMIMTRNCTDDLTENKREDKIIKKLCNNVRIGDNP